MRHVDFSPLYRSTVGFDRLFSMLDTLASPEGNQSYPPYNIERTGENTYRITMAVAGFSESELEIEAHRNLLTIKGQKADENDSRTDETAQDRSRQGWLRQRSADRGENRALSLVENE